MCIRDSFLYIAPAMGIMTLLTVFPSFFLYLISLTNYQLGWGIDRVKFVGVDNYIRLFTGGDPDFWNAIVISLWFMVCLLYTSFSGKIFWALASIRFCKIRFTSLDSERVW